MHAFPVRIVQEEKEMAKDAAKESAIDAEKEATPAKSNKKLVLIIAAVLLLGGSGAAGWYLTKPQAEPKEVQHEEVSLAPVYMTLETFTVNLQPDPGEQYLQTEMSLQIADSHEEESIKQYMPLVRNRILMVLSAKRSSEITTPEGKNLLKKQLISELNKPFAVGDKAQTISDVLFTSFIVQ
jgi:flagellar FliL protein